LIPAGSGILPRAEGDRIFADGRLAQESDLRVDQSTLAGEAHPKLPKLWEMPLYGHPHDHDHG
jgi:hypothetical protein